MFKSKSGNQRPIRGELTDIWALGITIFELIMGKTPYSHIKNPFLLKETVQEQDIDLSVIKNP